MNEIQEIRYQVGEAWKGAYNAATTYSVAAVVQDPTGLSVYRSLKSGNVNHPLTDTTWWFKIIDMSSIKSASDTIVALNTEIAGDEAARVSAENSRVSAENSRASAETGRVNAESGRVSAEQGRAGAETSRVGAESGRVSAETGRVNAEASRVTAEQGRVTAENLRDQSESARATAENNRAAAETERQSVAASDHTQAGNDHTQAASDHTQAASDHGTLGALVERADADHTQASNDHTLAASDHSTAGTDHTTAGNDHTTAQSDHTTAGNDHTQAGNDHTRAESDHTRAESDHAAVEVYVDSLGVFDLSKHNAVGGVLATYADLSAALTALNALDSKYKYGGMSFKFVLTSDNKYVQYFLTKDEWSLSEADWQKMNLEEEVSQLGQELGKVFGLELYKTQLGYPATNTQRIVSFPVDMKAGRFYTFSIDETPAGCLTYVDVYTSDFVTQLFRLDAGSNHVFYAKQNYASINIIMRADGSIQDGEAHFNVYENQFICSDYFANILKLESEIGIKYTETQAATTAEWHFEKVIDGRKGYIRIYSNDEIRESNFSIPGQTSSPINSYFKYVDATAVSGTKVYVISNANATLYLEFIDECVLSNAIFGTQKHIEKTFEIAFRGETSMVPIVVKKDGTGDFTTIQEAINSIHDASVIKQYDIQVYDDFDITDLTELWQLNYPNTHPGSVIDITMQCALVITKDYVNVRGVGRRRRLSVISPSNLLNTSFQNIQVVIPQGNCTIKNFEIVLQGGRYAIHQENFGNLSGINNNATTVLEDLVVLHKGNSMYRGGSGWTASLAQANGAASGCHWIYKNCVWNAKEQGSPMYMHLNPNFNEPANIEFINCAFIPQVSLTLAQSVNQCFISDLGSNMGAKVKLRGNSFTGFNAFSFATIKGNEQTRVSDDICEGEINYIGDSNLKMVVNIRENPSLAFRSIANNVAISVVGGTAYDALWGGTYASFGGSSASSNVKGICVGRRKIYDQPDSGKTSIFSLAYRLGNCANEAKTLIVNVGGTEYPLIFNQNYMTSDGSAYSYNTTPRYTNAEIIAQINAMFPEILEAQIGGWKEIQTPADAKMGGIVFNNNNIEFGKVVAFIKDYGGAYNRLVPATIPNNENRILIGVICSSTNRGNASMVALADKNYFPMSLLYPGTATAGTLFKVTSGNLVITTTESEASFYAIDDDTIAYYDGKKRLG